MARLKFKFTYPPGGWVYTQQETRLKITGSNRNKLLKLVLDHRAYKGLPRATPEEVEVDVERQICSRLTKNECISEGPDDELRPVEESQMLSIKTVVQFSKAAMSWLASGAKVVEPTQLDHRQNGCLNCPLNRPVKSCKCSPFYKAVDALVPAARRKDGLFICHACGCSTLAKTQMPLDMVLKADEGRDVQYPATCWVSEERSCLPK